MEPDEASRVMRWFTDDWHHGALTDKEVDRAVRDYSAHLADLLPRLPSELQDLARLNLHDGQVQEWKADDVNFAWRLLVGDRQHGYQFADITYRDVELVCADAGELSHLLLTEPAVELVSYEIDNAAAGRYEHRFYFWPGHEFAVRFGSVSVHQVPASVTARR